VYDLEGLHVDEAHGDYDDDAQHSFYFYLRRRYKKPKFM